MQRILAGLLLAFAMASVDAQPASRYRLVEEMRIDGVEQEFTAVRQFAVHRSGHVFVAQPMDNAIRIFNASGSKVTTIGRAGSGPGEFRGLGSIGFIGDTLYATDFQQRRTTLFGVDGKYLRTILAKPIPAEAVKIDTGAHRYLNLLPSRLLTGNRALAYPSIGSQEIADGKVTAIPLLRTTWDGEPQRILAMLSRQNTQLSFKVGNGAAFTSQPFADGPVTSIAPSGQRIAVVTGDPTAKLIRIVDINIDGDTVGRRSVPYTPVPLPARIVDSTANAIKEMWKRRGADVDIRKLLYAPPYYKAVRSALLQDDGSIWLGLTTAGNQDARWLMVDARGQLIGEFTAPASVNIRSLQYGIWATVLDEDDVPSVVRFRLERVR